MADQEGILPYSGKLGDTVGYRRGKKYYKRAKPASYQPTAESQKSGAEFGAGSKAAALLKSAFRPLVLQPFKLTLHNRLAGKLREVIRTGPTANKGHRGVFDGNLSLLSGFQLNPRTSFYHLCAADIDTQITASQVNIQIDAFTWINHINAPQSADRLKMGWCFVFADFNTGHAESLHANHLVLEKDRDFPGASLSVDIPDMRELAVFVISNVFFEMDSFGYTTNVERQNFQAGTILKAAHIRDGALVEFIAETLPEKPEKPLIKPDVFWKMEDGAHAGE